MSNPNLAATASPPPYYWEPGDAMARKNFVAYHDLRHRAYRKAASRMGVSLGASQLASIKELDEDWFMRHALVHANLKTLFPQQGEQVTLELIDTRGEDDPHFADWQRRHALIHARLDTAFGIV